MSLSVCVCVCDVATSVSSHFLSVLVLSTGSCRDNVSVSGQSYSPVFECKGIVRSIVSASGIRERHWYLEWYLCTVSLSGCVVWCKKKSCHRGHSTLFSVDIREMQPNVL